MKQSLGLAALASASVLALPALASAHPSVYPSVGYTAAATGTPGEFNRVEHKRYVVTNHGFTIVLRETNNVGDGNVPLRTQGVVGYNLLPSDYRKQAGKSFATLMGEGGTGAQAHATCLTPSLQSEAAVKSWQDADAFYNYVPFQTTTAGLEDDPARWLPTLTNAGFDTSKLATAAAAEAECEKVPGAEYVPADTVVTTAAALSAGTVAEATAPLQSQIKTLETGVSSLQAQLAAASVPKPAPARALALTLSAKKFDQGVAMLTGEPGTQVTVRALLSSANAKKLKIARTLSSKKVTINAQGAALVNLTLTSKARKAVDKHKPSLKVTVDATAGAVKQTAAGTLTR
jgi:hypothetical protein